jgi:hypothetical protein
VLQVIGDALLHPNTSTRVGSAVRFAIALSRNTVSGSQRVATRRSSPGRGRIERAVRFVVLNFPQAWSAGSGCPAASTTSARHSLPANPRIASIDGQQHNVMTSARFVVQIASRNQRAEIAVRRTVLGEASDAVPSCQTGSTGDCDLHEKGHPSVMCWGVSGTQSVSDETRRSHLALSAH